MCQNFTSEEVIWVTSSRYQCSVQQFIKDWAVDVLLTYLDLLNEIEEFLPIAHILLNVKITIRNSLVTTKI